MKKILLTILVTTTMTACFNQPDFTTTHGVNIYLGQKNKPTQLEVEMWSDFLISFWKVENNWNDCVTNALSGTTVHFLDTNQIELGTMKMVGMTNPWNKESFITMKHKESLYKHEVSHILYYFCNADANQSGAAVHQYFRELNTEF